MKKLILISAVLLSACSGEIATRTHCEDACKDNFGKMPIDCYERCLELNHYPQIAPAAHCLPDDGHGGDIGGGDGGGGGVVGYPPVAIFRKAVTPEELKWASEHMPPSMLEYVPVQLRLSSPNNDE